MQNEVANPPEAMQETKRKKKKILGMSYIIDDKPPWILCFALGFQHYLTMLGGTLGIPFIIGQPMCFQDNYLATSEVLSTIFFISGIVTFLQSTFGVRLPIVQGGTFTFIAPTFAILSLEKWKCPSSQVELGVANATNLTNGGDNNDIWKSRMREVQGAIMVSSLFQIVIGFTGLIGFLLRFIGPLAVAPTITLIGVALFHVAADHAGSHWGISMMTIALIAIFSQILPSIKIPVPGYGKERGIYKGRLPLFRLFPIILAIVISWIVCAIVTAAGGFPSDPKSPGYKARTDARTAVLQQSDWFRVPYPGQWGMPTVSASAVFGMLAGVLASIIESVGDYYACARLSGAPTPPKHAVNRGIGMEGIGCLIAGAVGSGNGTTSYSENIGAIGITKVGSLRVVQCGAVVMIVIGVFAKIGAVFTTIPDPIVGGVFMVMFGIIAAVGLSNLQYADMNSSRNLFIVGVSLLLGLAIPHFLNTHDKAIQTGVAELDNVITVLLKTSMAVGGITGLLLDNLIPGTPEERGLKAWHQHLESAETGDEDYGIASVKVYDLPFGLNRLSSYKFAKYMPFIPYYPDGDSDNIEIRGISVIKSEPPVPEHEDGLS